MADLDSLQSALTIDALRESVNLMKWILITGGGALSAAIGFLTKEVLACKNQRVEDMKSLTSLIAEIKQKLED